MSTFPVTRLRRLRRTSGLRGLVRETRIGLDDFVMPLFIGPEALANPDLPGLGRHSVESVVAEADELANLGVRAVILFGIPEEKDEEGSGAYDDDGVVQRALRALRGRGLVLFTDVCLCEYTDHGHCGVIETARSTTTRRWSSSPAPPSATSEAGADVVVSQRHDGRPGRRDPWLTLPDTPIVAYSAVKYASALLRAVPRGRRVQRPHSATGAVTRWIRPTARGARARRAWTSRRAPTS